MTGSPNDITIYFDDGFSVRVSTDEPVYEYRCAKFANPCSMRYSLDTVLHIIFTDPS